MHTKMGFNSEPILLLIILLLSFSVAFRAEGGRMGGWQEIKDPKDPEIQEIGRFAVNEYNKQTKSALTFEKVIGGDTQVVAGTNYRLVIAAKDGVVSNKYEAVVWDKPWQHFRNLTSFKSLV